MSMEQIILADLAARHPDGYLAFSRGGKRCEAAPIYVITSGYSVNVNETWLVYDGQGQFVGKGTQPRSWKRHPPRQNHSSRGSVAAARLARGIARIEAQNC